MVLAYTLAIICAIAFLLTLINYVLLRFRIDDQVRDRVDEWQERELERLRLQSEELAEKEARHTFEVWKQAYEKEIRQDAIKKSKAVTGGKVTEHFVPFFHEFPFNPSDARFLGSPIDFVVFDGLEDDEEIDVVFIEVKTGSSSLTRRERRVRDAVQQGRVNWVEARRKPPASLEITNDDD